MQQKERCQFLIHALQEKLGISTQSLKEFDQDPSKQLRALMNICPPMVHEEAFWQIQDAYLKEVVASKGIVDIETLPTIDVSLGSHLPFAEKMVLWQGDITRLSTDAIVNAANHQMLGCFVPCHGCIDNAIGSIAGLGLRQECAAIMEKRREAFGKDYVEPNGTVTCTKGYNLPAAFVLHTVGPIIDTQPTARQQEELASCYRNCLGYASEHGFRSIAFCCISTGEFHYPPEQAASVAIEVVTEFLAQDNRIEKIIFNVFKTSDLAIYRELLS